MAGLGAKLFASFTKLTAADVNGYLADQAIMRFATSVARDAAFGGAGEPTLAEGMTCYLDDTNQLLSYTGSAWAMATSAVVADITARTALVGAVNGSQCYVQSLNEPQVFNGSVWVTMLPKSVAATDISPTTSGSHTNSAFAVSAYTGTSAVVTLTCAGLSNSGGSTTILSFAVSGATTIAGADANGVQQVGSTSVGRSRLLVVTGLTAGLNTFTICSRQSGAGGLILTPSLTVQAVI
jgi:hypothetical protein